MKQDRSEENESRRKELSSGQTFFALLQSAKKKLRALDDFGHMLLFLEAFMNRKMLGNILHILPP